MFAFKFRSFLLSCADPLAYYCSSHCDLAKGGGDSSINNDAGELTIFQYPPSTQKVVSQHEIKSITKHIT